MAAQGHGLAAGRESPTTTEMLAVFAGRRWALPNSSAFGRPDN